jgi:hypothetical protein
VCREPRDNVWNKKKIEQSDLLCAMRHLSVQLAVMLHEDVAAENRSWILHMYALGTRSITTSNDLGVAEDNDS